MIKVSMEVDEDIKKCTTKCNKGMPCLSDKGYELCKVVRSTSGNIIFIECLEQSPCNYRNYDIHKLVLNMFP